MKFFSSFSQIVVFVKIAETGSLTKAAHELNLTPSAISKSLSQLENSMGTLLIKRTTRSAILTEQGRAFYIKASEVLNDLEGAVSQIQQFNRMPTGTLRITSSVAFGCMQLASAVNRYMDEYPYVDTQISLNDHIVNLSEENYDIALRITSATNWNYAARKLAEIRWVYCASPEYLRQNPPINKPNDLYMHKCLVYPAMTTKGSWGFINIRTDEVSEVEIHGRLICNSSLALHISALEGQGVACLPTYIASRTIAEKKLIQVLPDYRSTQTHTLYAMYFHSKYQNPLIRSFIDFMVDLWTPLPPWEKDLIAIKTDDGTGFQGND